MAAQLSPMPTASALHPSSASIALAFAALAFASVYFAAIWFLRRKRSLPSWPPCPAAGGVVSFLLIEASCAAAANGDWLLQVTALAVGLSSILGFAALCVGYIFLARLGRECVQELRQPEEASPAEALLQLLARLLAIVLAMAAVVYLSDPLPYPYDWIGRKFLWFLIAAAFYQLWVSRSLASKLLRALLLLLFAAVLVGGTAGFFHLLFSHVSPWLVVPLAGAVGVNVAFYFRLRALPEADPETVGHPD
jgi:hypothetical protein